MRHLRTIPGEPPSGHREEHSQEAEREQSEGAVELEGGRGQHTGPWLCASCVPGLLQREGCGCVLCPQPFLCGFGVTFQGFGQIVSAWGSHINDQ